MTSMSIVSIPTQLLLHVEILSMSLSSAVMDILIKLEHATACWEGII